MLESQKHRKEPIKGNQEDENIDREEAWNVSNEYLGQMGPESEGKTESHQGNWSGNYGFIDTSAQGSVMPDYSASGEDNSQSGDNIGNGLTSEEEDLIALGQHVDDTGIEEAGGFHADIDHPMKKDEKEGDDKEKE